MVIRSFRRSASILIGVFALISMIIVFCLQRYVTHIESRHTSILAGTKWEIKSEFSGVTVIDFFEDGSAQVDIDDTPVEWEIRGNSLIIAGASFSHRYTIERLTTDEMVIHKTEPWHELSKGEEFRGARLPVSARQ